MRWFVSGDKHGDIQPILDFIKRFNLGADSAIIILGDFGLAWRKDLKDYNATIKKYEENCNNVHLFWIDGNHDNFDIIKSWNCPYQTIYNNSEHIHYCPRGFEMYINDKRALFLGGADSIDKFRRTEHLNWWKEEMITEEDISKAKGHYDYVFTHCCPYNVFKEYAVYLITLAGIDQSKVNHNSELMLEKLSKKITFDKWFFAHYHINKQLNDKYTCLLNDFIEL